MLDVFNIPGQQDNVKIFYAAGATAWQTWTKPRNCKFIWMMCIGGAGGGNGGIEGAGFSSGTGGGSGGVVRALFPANVLPDTLFIQVGPGGAGGASASGGSSGGAGNRSFVSIVPSSATVMNIVCTSGTAAAAGGAAPATAASVSGETIATVTAAGFFSLGNFIALAGVTATGGQSSVATNITPLQNTITCPGAAGAGITAGPSSGVASSILSTAISPQLSAGANGSSANAGSGASGITVWKPFYSLGGAGGGVVLGTFLGGNGGDGGIGSGGGGAGGNNSSVAGSGGRGGKGGDGLVIIATF